MLWSDSKQRTQRAQEKRERVLHFLRLHTYSDLDTLSELFGFTSKASISRLLSRLIAEGFVKKVILKEDFFKKTFFGITRVGLEHEISKKVFYPSNVNIKNWKHTQHCQRASIYFLNHAGTKKHGFELRNVENGDIKKYNLKHRPDLLLESKSLGYICIEVELSIKAKERYTNIFREYNELILNQKVHDVIYVFYDQKKAEVFNKILIDYFLKASPRYKECKHKYKIKVF